MRWNDIGLLRQTGQGSRRARFAMVRAIVIAAAVAAASLPARAQTLPNAEPKPGQLTNPATSPGAGRTEELRRERFRRQAAETAQKQLEVLAERLREQLAKEVSARQAAEVVAVELLSREKLEDQIDSERQRLKGAGKPVAPQRAELGAKLGNDPTKLKALVKDLQRQLKASEWARKIAEAELRALSKSGTR